MAVRSPKRILVHDYSGHPFQAQLSRALAARGHEVHHVHCASYATGKGAVAVQPGDPATLSCAAIDLGSTFAKYRPFKRATQEYRYARAFIRHLRDRPHRPDVVLSSNVPLLAQRVVQPWVHRQGIRHVFWQQDIYSIAMSGAARTRLGLAGAALGRLFVAMEGSLLATSDAVVCISDDFLPTLQAWGIEPHKLNVVHNWAPLAELPECPRDNAWAVEHRLRDRTVLLYSGTLGLKHNPDLLLQLALRLRHRDDVVLVVCSEGMGERWLADKVAEHRLTNVELLGFQPYDRFPDVLASGDVLLVILEADAGAFSVPSKVLSYLCAGRALVAAVPSENLAARIIADSGAGVVVDPADTDRFAVAVEKLVADPAARAGFGVRARRYAEIAFDIEAIADRFERILTGTPEPEVVLDESLSRQETS